MSVRNILKHIQKKTEVKPQKKDKKWHPWKCNIRKQNENENISVDQNSPCCLPKTKT